MSFVRAKEIPPGSGNWYDYEVENYREGEHVKQRVIQYLGKSGKLGTTRGSDKISSPRQDAGIVLGTTGNDKPQPSTAKPKAGRIIAKIRKASDPRKKTEIWQSLDLPRDELEKIVRDMVLSLPPGHYKLHGREYGTNIVDTMYNTYGWMPSLFVNESMMLGLQALYPKKVYASFTLGLDAIEIIKKKGKS